MKVILWSNFFVQFNFNVLLRFTAKIADLKKTSTIKFSSDQIISVADFFHKKYRRDQAKMMERLNAQSLLKTSLTSEIRQTLMSGGPGLDDTYDILLASHHEPKVIKHFQSFFLLGIF